MAAIIAAACSPLEMIADGEDHVAAIVEVIVRVHGSHSLRFRKNGLGIAQFSRKAGNGLETGPAKARGIDALGGEPAQNVIRHKDLMAPARPLVEMTFRHAALIVAAAPGTLLSMTQAKVLRLRDRRCVVKSLCFHKISFV
jgi:hypothetical protein